MFKGLRKTRKSDVTLKRKVTMQAMLGHAGGKVGVRMGPKTPKLTALGRKTASQMSAP